MTCHLCELVGFHQVFKGKPHLIKSAKVGVVLMILQFASSNELIPISIFGMYDCKSDLL